MFIAVMEAGSFTEAAERLGTSSGQASNGRGRLAIWVSLALVPILIGTIYTPHGAAGFFFSTEAGGREFPAFWAVTLIVQALLGDGAFALKCGNA